MSSASSSTAGSNAAAGNQNGQQASGGGGGGGSAGAVENGHGGSVANHGAEGNVVEQQPEAGDGGSGGGGGGESGVGTAEPPTTSSATPHNHRGSTGTVTTVLRRKTNVCLICGIYTNLSLNIFEPRNGPNIVDVIYEKYKFRAERGDNADKHICFSCNNWLINWYSLQNTSSGSSRSYEPAPSTSRSSSAAADSSNNSRRGRHHQGHKPRTKTSKSSVRSAPTDKENCPSMAEQHDHVSSTTVPFSIGGDGLGVVGQPQLRHQRTPYAKRTRRESPTYRRAALRESNGPQGQRQRSGASKRYGEGPAKDELVVSSSTEQQQPFDPYTVLVKPFESQLIRMLEGQGTSVTKESVSQRDAEGRVCWQPSTNGTGGNPHSPRYRPTRKRLGAIRYKTDDASGSVLVEDDDQVEDASNEIVLSFDSALSEVIDVVPSLNAIKPWWSVSSASIFHPADEDGENQTSLDPVGPLRHRLSSGALSMSIVHAGQSRSVNIHC